jgi:hypothetical protein
MTWILDHPERARDHRRTRLIELTRGAEIAPTSHKPCIQVVSSALHCSSAVDALKKYNCQQFENYWTK